MIAKIISHSANPAHGGLKASAAAREAGEGAETARLIRLGLKELAR